MSDVLRDLSRVQAVRPTCHWWRCPRLLAWFRVLMMVSLVKHPASAGLLSRIGDYLLLQHEGLGSDKNITDSAWPGRHQRRPGSIGTMTRSPPQPLFHRRLQVGFQIGMAKFWWLRCSEQHQYLEAFKLLSDTVASNELMRQCFMRRQSERLLPGVWQLFKLLPKCRTKRGFPDTFRTHCGKRCNSLAA